MAARQSRLSWLRRGAPAPSPAAAPARPLRRWAIAGGLIGALLALLLLPPAAWLAQALQSLSGARVLLLDARGTLWNGSAQLVLAGGAGSRDRAALPGRIDWRLRPALRGLDLQLTAGCCTPEPLRAQWQPRWGGARLTLLPGRSSWPSALLTGLGTPWNTIQPQGELSLDNQGLSFDWVDGRLKLEGRLSLEARDLASRLSTLRPLGSYRLTLDAAPAAPTLLLETLSGNLKLSGSGQWVGSRLRFAGEASAEAGSEAVLSNLLNIVGRRNGARSIIAVG